jgi:hypothetical protein
MTAIMPANFGREIPSQSRDMERQSFGERKKTTLKQF